MNRNIKCRFFAFFLLFLVAFSLISPALVSPALAQEGNQTQPAGNQTQPSYPTEPEEAKKSWWQQIGDAFWGAVSGAWNAVTGGLAWFWGTIKAIWDGLGSIGTLIVKTMSGIGRIIGEGINTFVAIFGRWGDPETYQNYALLIGYCALDVEAHEPRPELGNQTIFNVIIRENMTLYEIGSMITAFYPKTAPDFCWEWVKKNDTRTPRDITPQGLLGLMAWGLHTIWKSGPLFEFILKNFVMIHITIVVCLLVYGMYKSIQERDLEPILNSFHWIAKIFGFYIKVISWIIEKAVDLATAIAQWIETILPF